MKKLITMLACVMLAGCALKSISATGKQSDNGNKEACVVVTWADGTQSCK